MARGAAKQAAGVKKARQDRIIKHELRQAAPAEVKDGKAAIDKKLDAKKP